MGCRPRRRGVPLRRPVSSTPSSIRRSSALNAERAHFCARTRSARFWFPYAGMPDLVVRPAKSDLRLKIAYGCSSLRGRVPHDGGRVFACPSAVTLKAAVDVSSPLIGRPMGRTRVPSGFRPRGFSRPAVAGVGRRARRAWKLKTPCGSGEPRSTVFRQQLTYLHPVLERSLFPHGECSPRFAVRRSSTHSSVRS